MKKQPLLTDLEDRVMAACDDMYLEATIAQDVLSSWYGRPVSFRELRAAYRKLSGLGFLKTYLKTKGRYTPVELMGHKTEALSARATARGRGTWLVSGMCANNSFEFAPDGRPTRKSDALSLAAQAGRYV
jgi:hypothetical protein